MYVGNVLEDGFENNPHLDRLREHAAKEGAPVVALCAKIEAELADLDDADKQEFLADLGLDEPGLNRLIRTGYELLGLQTYFTAGVKEVRAWTIHKGDTARAGCRRDPHRFRARLHSCTNHLLRPTSSPAAARRARKKKARCV